MRNRNGIQINRIVDTHSNLLAKSRRSRIAKWLADNMDIAGSEKIQITINMSGNSVKLDVKQVFDVAALDEI